METLWPPIVRFAVRLALVSLAGIPMTTTLDPEPAEPCAMVAHG
jgi:hypothetical protein